jgi:hypothetical protein
MAQAQSIWRLLTMLPERQTDQLLRQLSPEAVQALKKLEAGAGQLKDPIATEIANAVWDYLDPKVNPAIR